MDGKSTLRRAAVTGGSCAILLALNSAPARADDRSHGSCAPGSAQCAGGAGEWRSAAGAIALRAALGMLGVPYSWGGGGPAGPGFGVGTGRRTWGFDCSGLTEYAWAAAGVRIGPTTREQWRSGARIRKAQVRPGDLVFYDSKPKSPGPEHVGLAVDRDRIVNAPFTGEVVRLDPLNKPHFMGVVRPGAAAPVSIREGAAGGPGSAAR
ncbi:C40 family peptidase [Nonomuraea sp. NPDC048916]|uniref:C40 family peptidase n=1 Tax=Nonomuraea sp. NPDC048916 TaxID=3154232 RepID=UPI0033E864A9